MKYLLKYIKKYTKECITAPLFKMLEALFDLFVPVIVAYMIDPGIKNSDKGVIIKCSILLVILALVGLACSFVAQFFAAKAATGSACDIRHDLFAHISSLSSSELDKIGNSTLITRMTSDINQVQGGLNLFLRLFLRSPFIVFGAMIMAFTINTEIALIFVAVIPVLSVIVFGIMRLTSPGYKKIQSSLDEVTKKTRENLSGVRVVRAFGREEDEIHSFSASNGELVKRQTIVGRISALMNPVTYVVINLGIVAILYMGQKKVDLGILQSGNIIALVNYMSQILVELVKLANLIVTLSKSTASMSRISAIFDIKSSMEFKKNSDCSEKSDIAVEFRNVSLKYQSTAEMSIENISFTAKKGETIGIIGGTGSGKSSVVKLINREYDASDGNVILFGHDIKDWTKAAIGEKVGVVMQHARLFKGTIRSNLLYGKENASDEELWQALEVAQAVDFVREKSLGLDEKVEQGGRNLSGGQRQRLTIARAVVKKPEILILDDSASALDLATDSALRKAIKTLPKSTTVFIVSQRTASLRNADKILVLEDGELVGVGTHKELLENCEVYREIHESQFRKEGE